MSSLLLNLYQQLDAAAQNLGTQLYQAGAVSDCQLLHRGEVVSGIVSENAQPPCRVYIQLSGSSISGECSCDQEENCQHVAALLLQANRLSPVGGTGEGPGGGAISPPQTIGVVNDRATSEIMPVLPREVANKIGLNTSVASSTLQRQQQRLVYRLQPLCYDNRAVAGVCAIYLSVSIHQQDETGQQSFLPFSFQANRDSYPRYVDEVDRQILSHRRFQQSSAQSTVLLQDGQDITLLLQCLQSGRCVWETLEAASGLGSQWLQADKTLGGEDFETDYPGFQTDYPGFHCHWQCRADGSQQLHLLPNGFNVIPGSSCQVYFRPETVTWGLLSGLADCALKDQQFSELCQREAVTPTTIALIEQRFPTLPPLVPLQVIELPMQPLSTVVTVDSNAGTHTLQVHFEYKDHRCRQGDGAEYPTQFRFLEQDIVYSIARNVVEEQKLQQKLVEIIEGIGLLGKGQPWSLPLTIPNPEHWVRFFMLAVPQLQALGIRVETASNFPHRLLKHGNWYGDLSKQSKSGHGHRDQQWFDFELGVTVEGDNINLLPMLVTLLSDHGVDALMTADLAQHMLIDKQLIFPIPERGFLALPIEKIQRIVQHLIELTEQRSLRNSVLAMPQSQLLRLQNLMDDFSLWQNQSTQWQDSAEVKALSRALSQFDKLEICPAPPTLQAELRHYQQEGLSWLQCLRRFQVGGILADDMGLGKTLQTIAHLLVEKSAKRLRRPSLIVAPTSVLSNWQRELRRFAPSLSYCLWHGSERTNHKSAFLSADVVITSYALLHLDSDFLLAQQYTMVVLDEAQFIKNPRTKVSQAARQLVAEQRLCLSGTPVENHLGELWSLFDFVQPGLLGSEAQFSRLYRKPIEIQGSSYRSEILAKRLAPFILRRTKNQVAKDLPAKSEFIQTLTMGDAQRELYDSLRLSMHKQLRQLIAAQGVSGSHIEILDTLLKLRQVCCDPRLLAPSGNAQNGEVQKSDASNSDSVKMRFLVEQIPALIEEGRRILLFSQFTSVLTLVGQAMDAIEVPYLQLTGSTRNRQALVDRFQSGEIPLFLISLKAGGTGLNLTAADTVIHYDPWWNPAVEDQATDRAHRIGQDKPVFVYKLVTENTVEEKILALHARKRSLAEGIYTNKAASSMSIGVEDLEFLMQ